MNRTGHVQPSCMIFGALDTARRRCAALYDLLLGSDLSTVDALLEIWDHMSICATCRPYLLRLQPLLRSSLESGSNVWGEPGSWSRFCWRLLAYGKHRRGGANRWLAWRKAVRRMLRRVAGDVLGTTLTGPAPHAPIVGRGHIEIDLQELLAIERQILFARSRGLGLDAIAMMSELSVEDVVRHLTSALRRLRKRHVVSG